MVVAFVWVLPSFAPYGDVVGSLGGLDARWWTVVAVATGVNLVAPAGLQRAALPGLGAGDAILVDWVTSAVTNTVPGGSAVAVGLTWSMYRRLRLGSAAIARALVVTGVWDQIVKLSAPLLAVAWLSTERPVGPGLVQAAVVGGILFTVVVALCLLLVAGPRLTTALGSRIDRLPWIGAGGGAGGAGDGAGGDGARGAAARGADGWVGRLERLRIDTVTLVRDRWWPLTAWTIGGHLNLFVLLWACLRLLGVPAADLSAAAVFAALAFGRLVTALPLTPGGLGVMEVGLTGALAAVGTADEAAVVAAVLLFRAITFALPVPLGGASWLVWTARSPGRVTGAGALSPPLAPGPPARP